MRLYRWLLPLLSLLSWVALGQARTDLNGIVPGDGLGWEIEELSASVVVHKPTILNIQIYSPGFDPADYRRALKGQEELGDERYDKGRGQILAEFVLTRNGKVLAQETFGTEPHRWVLFFRGPVEPGVYLLKSRLSGLGKNAFRYRIQTSVPEAAELLIDPTLQLYDMRRATANFNIRGQDWLEPFVLQVSPEALPLTVGFYDEDGEKELEGRVRQGDGRVQSRKVSGDRSWAYYSIERPGRITFGFRQPRTATQYSNTIGFKVEACIEVEPGIFRVVPPRPVKAWVEDTQGQPVKITPIVEGDKVRTMRLPALPEGYRLVRLEVEGGEALDEKTARFGCAGGQARFVVEKPAPPPQPPARAPESTLEIEAFLVLPDGERPFDLPLRVGEQPVLLQEGRFRLSLPPGSYTLNPGLSGARIEGPSAVELSANQTQRVSFKVYPEAQLILEAVPTTLRVGEETLLVARARTTFSRLLPAELELVLPPCLEALSAPRLVAPIAEGREAVLQVQAKATCKGEPEVVATLAPWSQKAQARLRIIEPATFTLRKEALTPQVAVGGEAIWQLSVQNTGDEPGRVRLKDDLVGFDQTLAVSPGEERTFQVKLRVDESTPATLTNQARLMQPDGTPIAKAEAEVRVLRPVAELTRSLDKHLVVPGEEVEVRLVVKNTGQAPLRYTLRDAYPEWLDAEAPPEFSGELAPGATQTHTYRARVRFGPPAEGQFLAQLTSNGGSPSAADTLKRVLVLLEKRVEPGRVLQGGKATFTLRVGNPTDRPLGLRLQESPAPGLRMTLPENLEFTLKPGEVRELALEAQAEQTGPLDNQVTAFVGSTPASFPAKATLLALPILEPRRLSTVALDFKVESAPAASSLLLTHKLPEGSSYEPGSARLDGNPIPDPRVKDDRLFFELPYQSSGQLTYQLRHKGALPPLEKPTLTVQAGPREVYLQGQQGFADLEKAQPMVVKTRDGFIQEPMPGTVFQVDKIRVVLQTPNGLETRLSVNGMPVDSRFLGQATYDSGAGVQRLEYYGLPLKPGRNLIELETTMGRDQVEVFLADKPVRLLVRPVRLLADGKTPLELTVRAVDGLGLASGFGPLTVETSQEPLEEDAFPLLSGYQVLLKDGVARLRLKPTATPTTLRLRMAFGEITEQAELFVAGQSGTLWQAQGSLGVRIGDSIQVFGLGRGYLETPLGQGVLRGALDASLRFQEGRPQVQTGLRDQEGPTGRFPLTGAGGEATLPLRSDEPVALRYDQEEFSLGYYAEKLGVFGLGGLPQGTALRLETRGDLALQGFAGYLPVGSITERLTPDGTRYYKLSSPAEPGSEQVVLWVGSSSTRLERLKDYVLDADTGSLTLSKPLWPTAPDFQPVEIQVTYAPQGGHRELGYGAGARWRTGGFSIGLGAAYLPGQGWQMGAEAAYQVPGFGLRVSYSQGAALRYGLELSSKTGSLESSANLVYEGRLQGQAQVAYSLSEADRLSLEHQTSTHNRTDLLYIRRLSQSFSIGAGLGYTWEEAAWAGLGRLGLREGPFSAELTHAQPFSLIQSAATRLRSTYAFDTNLTAEADLVQTWGLAFSGTLALKQKLAGANLSLSYQLPGASGEGNRARFGLEAPLPLSETWSLSASAGYERSLNTGQDQSAFGLALRYKTQDFSAALGGETAFQTGNPKVMLRAGATGQLDAQQTLSLDATYQLLPTAEGRFTLAYALRGREASLLTYHRLTSTTERILEGSLATSYHPGLSFQLRPSAAYRVKLDDPAGNTYQVGLGANYYLTDWLGLGGGVYYQFQPATQSQATAFSLEGSLRIVEGLWFNLGYTFGGFSGLTPDTAPGFYLRLDFMGGGR